MKHLINGKDSGILVLLLFAMVLTFSACEPGTPVRDAEYPDQVIYLPAAVRGLFQINDISRIIGDSPIPGNPYRYVLDLENEKGRKPSKKGVVFFKTLYVFLFNKN